MSNKNLYFRKHYLIHAVQWFPGKNVDGVIEEQCRYGDNVYPAFVNTPDGPQCVSSGDFIITGAKGEIFTCKPDVFEAYYEAVPFEFEELQK